MRTFAAAAALALAMATGAAANKPVTTIGEWTDPAAETRPAGLPSGYKWSYWPNSWGTTCVSGPCCGGSGQEPCGPLNWVQQWPNCGTGQQTPIDLDINEDGYTGLSKTAGSINFKGFKCAGEVVPKNGTFEFELFDCAKQSSLTVNGKKWVLWQIHLHGVSEHSVNGGYYPMEAHLVHLPEGASPTDSNLAPSQVLVVGVFLTVGKPNSVFSTLTQHTAETEGPLAKPINPYQLLPKGDKSYWNYLGSLTTPFKIYGSTIGCNIGNGPSVNWYVMKKPVSISPAQLAWATQYLSSLPLTYLGTNNRPIQPVVSPIASYGKRLN